MLITVKRRLLILLCLAAPVVAAAAPPPAFTYQSMLNTFFDDKSGLIRIRNIDLAFAPEGQINAAVALVGADNKVIKSHKFYPDPRWRETVFARLAEVSPAEFKVSKPGVYGIIYLLDGKPVSRLPISLEQTSAGDDPFNPVKTYRFTGMWQRSAYLTMNKNVKEKPFPELHFWVGGKDLPEGKSNGRFNVTLKHKGKVIAHSRDGGFIANKHYQPAKINLYHPHASKQAANAKPFLLSDWSKTDGVYDLEITRQSDELQIRSFNFTVKNHEIQPLKASVLGFNPSIDYIVPRVTYKGASNYEFIEAIWLKGVSKNRSVAEGNQE